MSETTPATADLYRQALSRVDDIVLGLGDDDWAKPSPCRGWSAEDVLYHVAEGAQQAAGLLDEAGATADVSTTADGRSTRRVWSDTHLRVSQALGQADLGRVVESRGRALPLEEALALPTMDAAVHSWDLAASVGADRELPAGLLAFLKERFEAMPEDQWRRPGFFGPAVQAPAGATATDRLMAWLGRTVPDAG